MKSVLAALVLALLGLNIYQWRATEVAAPAPPDQRALMKKWSHQDLDPASRRAFIDEFMKLWATTPNNMLKNRWLGVRTLQNPFDVWITQEIMFETKPDLIVEAGTRFGGSAVLWAMILEHIVPDGRVITIDIEDARDEKAKQIPIAQHNVEFLLGSSTDPDIVATVYERAKDKRVMVILDSLHTKAHVLRELEVYADLIEVGGYIIVQDGVVNGHPLPWQHGPGPWEAVEEFLSKDNRFEVDLSRERLLITNNPHGFLTRVR